MTCSFNIYSYYAYLCRVWVKAILNKRKYPKYYSNQFLKHFDNQNRVFKGMGVVFCTQSPWDFIPHKIPGLIGLKLDSHLPNFFIICFNDENWFLLHVKSSFRSQDVFSFLSWLFGHVEKTAWLERSVNFKTYDVTAWLAMIYNTHIAQYLKN